ncbi:MAG TPA: hypothetical protein VIG54_06325 [Lysobacter sp.]
MRRHLAALAFSLAATNAVAAPPTLAVGNMTYVHRYSDGGLHEYTPEGQDDLDRFADMLTLLPTPEDLRAADLESYSIHMAAVHTRRGGEVLSRECEAATPVHVADCTLLIRFAKAGHVELAVDKQMATKRGLVAMALAHREYGEGAAGRAVAWTQGEGQRRIADFIDWADRLGRAMDDDAQP